MSIKSSLLCALALLVTGCEVNTTFFTPVYVEPGAVQFPTTVNLPPGTVQTNTYVESTTYVGAPDAGLSQYESTPALQADAGIVVDVTTSASLPATETPAAAPVEPIVITVTRTDAVHANADVTVAPGWSGNLRSFLVSAEHGTAALDRFIVQTFVNTNISALGECRLHAWPETDRCTSATTEENGILTFDLADGCLIGSAAAGQAVLLDVDCDVRTDALHGISYDLAFANGEATSYQGSAEVVFYDDVYVDVHTTTIKHPLSGRANVTQLTLPSTFTTGDTVIARFDVEAVDGNIEFEGYAWSFGVELPIGGSFTTSIGDRQLRVVGTQDGLNSTVVEGSPSGLPYTAAFNHAFYIPQGYHQTFELVIPVGGEILPGAILRVTAADVKVNGNWYATSANRVFTAE